jgi:hypothetical protein
MYDDAGIPHDTFFWSYYDMNLHQVETMAVDDGDTCRTYIGSWIRINMSTGEVAEENWYCLELLLRNLCSTANPTGIEPLLALSLSGYFYTNGDDYLLRFLSWEENGDCYQELTFEMIEKVHSLG